MPSPGSFARAHSAPARILALFLALVLLHGCSAEKEQHLTISLVGLNDVHGQLLPQEEKRGIVVVAEYIDALRIAARARGDEVLVIDAGDMWQGTLESNIEEGAPMIAAYNALGVAAAAIGNHEFDFGPVGPDAIPVRAGQDPRGALRQRAREAAFPLLTANLIDEQTGELVDWDNVYPSVMLEVGDLKVGVIGVMTRNALVTTIAANTIGLQVTPLPEAIIREGEKLRAEGANLIIVTAHAGSRCESFDDPNDTSSCEMDGEIMRVAQELPPGLVDHIVAGHVHRGIAHIVNGISITSAFSSTRAVSRTDFILDRRSGDLLERRVFAPTDPQDASLGDAGEVTAIAHAARDNADALKSEALGVTLTAEFALKPDINAAIGNLFTTAVLESFDADIAIHNVFGGIRNGLPAGPLTFGDVYEVFPFDNVVTIHELTGRELRTLITRHVGLHRKPGFAGMRVTASCANGKVDVSMRLDNGREIADDDMVRVVANDFLAFGGDDILTTAIPAEGFEIDYSLPRTRDALVAWFKARGGELDPADWRTHDEPRWQLDNIIPGDCGAQALYSD